METQHPPWFLFTVLAYEAETSFKTSEASIGCCEDGSGQHAIDPFEGGQHHPPLDGGGQHEDVLLLA